MYLSAAQDILRSSQLPAGIVLIADIAPALMAKYIMTRFIGRVDNRPIVMTACLLTVLSILMVVYSGESVMRCLLGITFASFSSGMGESNFLTMATSSADSATVVGWASGTGAAGLVGSIMYYSCTVLLGMAPSMTLLSAGLLPVVMWMSYLRIEKMMINEGTMNHFSVMPNYRSHHKDDDKVSSNRAVYGLFIPLFVIYLCEYTVNMGVVPLIARRDRQVYVGCQALYQLGVFSSRTLAMTFFPKGLSTVFLAILQSANLLLALILLKYDQKTAIAVLMVFEGLIGGSGYVMTFSKAQILPNNEHIVSRVSMADCLGILSAGVLACAMENIHRRRHIYY